MNRSVFLRYLRHAKGVYAGKPKALAISVEALKDLFIARLPPDLVGAERAAVIDQLNRDLQQEGFDATLL